MKNTRIIKALAIGISASMLLQPIMVLAAEATDEKKEITVDAEVSAPSYEEVKEEIEDTVNEEISDADQKVESANALEDYDYNAASDAIGTANENLNNAANDVQNAEDKLGDENKADENLGVKVDLIDKNTEDANNALEEAENAMDDASKAEKGIDAEKSTVKEAEDAVNEIQEDIKKAEDGIKKADELLNEAQSALDKANDEYKALESDKNASEKALSDAKQKVIDAEKALEDAKASVENNKQTAEGAFSDAQKLEAFKQISDLKDEIAAMNPEDKEYESKLDELSRLIVEFYVIDKVDEGTEIVFGEESEEYTTGYTTDENGTIVPIKETITYKTVTYVVDGETITKKIEFGLNDDGAVAITEKKISADEEEGLFIPETETVLTDEDGNEFVETENSIVIFVDPEDESKGFFAVDTATTEPVNENILPEENSVEETKEDTGIGWWLNHRKTFDKLVSTGGEAVVTYELLEGNIAEITSRDYQVDYTAYDEYMEECELGEFDDLNDAIDAKEAELLERYGEGNVEIIYEPITKTGFMIIYSVTSKATGTMLLQESRNVYAASEYIDRSPAPVYRDEEGNTYDDSLYNVNVSIDPENSRKGFYATNTEDLSLLLRKDIDEPYSKSKFERDEEGHQKATYIDVDPKEMKVTTVYSRETINVIDGGFTTEKEVRVPSNKEELYQILNEYQGLEDVVVILKGNGDSSFDTEITYDRGWYTIADEKFDQLIDETGGCVIEISRDVPNTHEETGIVERVITEYNVTTTVFVDNSADGICSTKEEAEKTARQILTELSKKYNIIPEEPVIVEKKQGDDTVWEYVINYRIRTLEKTEIQSFETAKSGYKDVLYKNELAESKEYYRVSVDSEVLASAADEKFNNAVEEKKNAYLKASEAKEKATEAATAFEKALNAVSQAKASVEALEKAGVPQTVLDAAKAKLSTAQQNLANAQVRKADADAALLLATASLEYAQEKLETIKKNNPAPAPSSSGAVNRAENVASVTGAQTSSDDATVSTASAPAAAQAAASDGAAVLGAKKTDDKKNGVKKIGATETKADSEAIVESDANADDKVKLTDSSEKNDNSNAVVDNSPVVIPDVKPALAAAPTPPEDNASGMIRVLMVMMVLIAAVVAGAISATALAKKPK